MFQGHLQKSKKNVFHFMCISAHGLIKSNFISEYTHDPYELCAACRQVKCPDHTKLIPTHKSETLFLYKPYIRLFVLVSPYLGISKWCFGPTSLGMVHPYLSFTHPGFWALAFDASVYFLLVETLSLSCNTSINHPLVQPYPIKILILRRQVTVEYM